AAGSDSATSSPPRPSPLPTCPPRYAAPTGNPEPHRSPRHGPIHDQLRQRNDGSRYRREGCPERRRQRVPLPRRERPNRRLRPRQKRPQHHARRGAHGGDRLMARYRKRPVEIEAVQWTEDVSMRELIDFTNGRVKLNDVDRDFHVYDRLHDTWVKFEYGDWIIKGVQGEYYPCRDDVFAATYEAVTDRWPPYPATANSPSGPSGKLRPT